ncbi:MAG: DJ-1/PfpI family protein [Planctomycetes bacterium]|nr:DJ-1/PfpI family protein [Planctomycetota bacterium]MBU1517359.1 DJ-1/PfpI family protein [Planctomycetota bacterium]MBU2457682.1 DJ-1/PfpI family protein [Planctomycetota bacterium]MBU2596019.1 DJ-1/PfpI family protein [Planctomycetota bacterium]
MGKKVLITVADGIEELEAIAIIDCLGRAGAELTIASVQKQQIATARKVKITADCLISDCAEKTYDLIVLPGGLPGAESFRDSKTLIEMLKKQREAGRFYAAICASPAIVFAHHGLLAGKKATCYPGMENKLPDASAANQMVVVDGNCITSRGPGTALEFSLKLVELLFGNEKAKQIAEAMLVR